MPYIRRGISGDEAAPELTEGDFRVQMLKSQREMVGVVQGWIKREEMQRWMQLAATLSIPIAAGFWKWLLKKSPVE